MLVDWVAKPVEVVDFRLDAHGVVAPTESVVYLLYQGGCSGCGGAPWQHLLVHLGAGRGVDSGWTVGVGAPTLGARLDPLQDKLVADMGGNGDGVDGGGLGLVCLLERGGEEEGAEVVFVEGCCGQHLLLVGPVEVVWAQQVLEGGHLADLEQILK